MPMPDLLIVGAGAAGLMAAGAACDKGARVALLEHNPKGPGQKILITGKGRCNLTNHCDVPTFLTMVRHNRGFCTRRCTLSRPMRRWSCSSAWACR